ncbi:hypothetical protein [Planctomycetes bacterium TBK1r]|uniref:VWFA domain-containing protein n=1 Tax=Stieleria magnilauensis TaxID=2527963 RepID=A0ABX5XHB2_9BACT|nr:hypothetical protein TBK1r_02970 [Planctomycetes bacterium TBK1r]
MTDFLQSVLRNAGIAAVAIAVGISGCVKTESIEQPPPFEHRELDACLAYVVDQSGSFNQIWENGGYDLFLRISDQFFVDSMGGETKLVIAQLSGKSAVNVVLFEGRPTDLRNRFQSPEDLARFLKEKSDPSGSQVFEATRRVTDYVMAMPDVTEQTKLMTVFFSDMVDTEHDAGERSAVGHRMLSSLTKYRELGGALAMYYVSPQETPRWRRICAEAGFERGRFVIESTLVENPVLPTFN